MKFEATSGQTPARPDGESCILERRRIAALLMLFLLPSCSCGRRSLLPGQLNQNRFFAEIIRRESSRDLGDDQFFERNLFTNPHAEVRRSCAISLGRIGDRRALPLLYAALHKGDATIRAASAFSIGEIEDRKLLEERNLTLDPRTLPQLTRLLEDPSLLVRMRAVEALGKTGSHGEAIMLADRLHHLFHGKTKEERVLLGFYIDALSRLNDPAACPILEKLSALGDPEILTRSLNALARLRNATREVQGGSAGEPIAPPSPLSEAVCIDLAAERFYPATAIIATTRGNIEIELFQQDAPVTTQAFLSMALLGSFEGLHFAKTTFSPAIEIEKPSIRTGPGLSVRTEINMHPFEKGSIGMALESRDFQSSRFFIALAAQPERDGEETCFGRVISGMQIAEKIDAKDSIKKVTVKKNVGFLNIQKF